MPERLPIALQRTLDNIIWWCDREEKDEFLADYVAAPRGHLRALANRGKVSRNGKMKGRGSGSPIFWKLVRNGSP
jgi:hypothetical protein